MKVNYLIRLDDASPYMDVSKWGKIEDILDKYDVKPLVGIIPANADSRTMISEGNFAFWGKVHRWIDKGWEIALHGYDHVCISDEGLRGLNPVWKRSEFAGVSLEVQKEKIRKGMAILNEHGINPKYFFAPSHTFDENTLRALQEESDIRIISDTYTLMPFIKHGFSFVPCQLGQPREMRIPGLYTICLHPNSMNNNQMDRLKSFLKLYRHHFISYLDIDFSIVTKMRLVDRVALFLYLAWRRVKRL